MQIDYSTIHDFRRRREETLVRMWRDLNVCRWPPELGPTQKVEYPSSWELMQQIASEIGRRRIMKIGYPERAKKGQVQP